MTLPAARTRHLFFTGKGGVGKTSLSCATGLALADSGKRVLIVSTDPASNLDEVLGVALSAAPTAVPGAPGLCALNIDPEQAAAAYRERMVAPYRGVLPAAALASIEEQFSGACTTEIAAFDEFSKLLGDRATTAEFDHVIFDTAPTGHTLRLLTLPSAWSGFIASSTGGASCLGPLAGLERQQALYAATVRRLADPEETTVVLVSRAERASLDEAERTRRELAELGIDNLQLAINGVFADPRADDAIACAMARRAAEAISKIPAPLAALTATTIPFLPSGTVGLAALRRMARADGTAPNESAEAPESGSIGVPPSGSAGSPPNESAEASESGSAGTPASDLPPGLAGLIDDIARAGRGVIMTMGKGGVGKTTVAAALALALAARGHRVTLSTTDPAAHLDTTLGAAVTGLTVERIDPAREVARYTEEVLANAGKSLDADGRAVLEEDLRSPCTEEIAVFRAFARTVAEGEGGFVVLDTAPTGHTILLLDAAEAYHREVLRAQGEMPESVRELLPRLRDAAYTRVLIVTLAEATPVHEAARLQGDLERAGIIPFAWVVNQSLRASGTRDPRLDQRGACELPFIREVAERLTRRAVLIPWLAEAPIGAAGLAAVVRP